jgi:hypothetical protein
MITELRKDKMLEDKIKEYLDTDFIKSSSYHGTAKTMGQVAHDIAEICLKDYMPKDDFIKLAQKGNKQLQALQKENTALKSKCNLCYESMAEKDNKAITELKEQIKNQKHLDRAEVEKIFLYWLECRGLENRFTTASLNDFITAILNLAIKPDKDSDISGMSDTEKEYITKTSSNSDDVVYLRSQSPVIVTKDKIISALANNIMSIGLRNFSEFTVNGINEVFNDIASEILEGVKNEREIL